jgi:hypothetical protein
MQDDIASEGDCTGSQEANRLAPTSTCFHQRLIDDVLTKHGKWTGRVRCIECGVEFPDPCQGQK